MNLKQSIVENIITPTKNQKYNSVNGTVISYNEITNTASVKFNNPNANGMTELDSVPVCIFQNGIHPISPQPGDGVLINFQNGSIHGARITAIYDNNFLINTKSKYDISSLGAFIHNEEIQNYKQDYPAINDLIDTSSKSDIYTYFKDVSPCQTFSATVKDIDNYASNEVGIISLDNTSMIKTKNNGIIELFVNNNLGMTFNAKTKTLDVYIDNIKIHRNNSITINDKEVKL